MKFLVKSSIVLFLIAFLIAYLGSAYLLVKFFFKDLPIAVPIVLSICFSFAFNYISALIGQYTFITHMLIRTSNLLAWVVLVIGIAFYTLKYNFAGYIVTIICLVLVLAFFAFCIFRYLSIALSECTELFESQMFENLAATMIQSSETAKFKNTLVPDNSTNTDVNGPVLLDDLDLNNHHFDDSNIDIADQPHFHDEFHLDEQNLQSNFDEDYHFANNGFSENFDESYTPDSFYDHEFPHLEQYSEQNFDFGQPPSLEDFEMPNQSSNRSQSDR